MLVVENDFLEEIRPLKKRRGGVYKLKSPALLGVWVDLYGEDRLQLQMEEVLDTYDNNTTIKAPTAKLLEMYKNLY